MALVASAGIGAFSFNPETMVRHLAAGFGWIAEPSSDTLGRNVFLQLRLPRVCLAALTGAVLGVSGTLMQGIFRNPIVEPGLAGTSAGAALGASLVFVFGGTSALARPLGSLAVPILAFIG
ncbi:MAG TPA: iron chelate uptake ABC transporter family permease subunit, partial [Gemmatimonadaceae bacterium]